MCKMSGKRTHAVHDNARRRQRLANRLTFSASHSIAAGCIVDQLGRDRPIIADQHLVCADAGCPSRLA